MFFQVPFILMKLAYRKIHFLFSVYSKQEVKMFQFKDGLKAGDCYLNVDGD